MEQMKIEVGMELTLDTIIGEGPGRRGEDGDSFPGEPITLVDAIVERAADKLVRLLMADAERLQPMTLLVRRVREDVIREKTEPIVAEALTKPFRMTDSYGSPHGAETTLTAIIVDESRKHLRKTNPRYASDGTIFDKVLAEITTGMVQKELAGELAEAKKAIRAQLRDVAANAVEQLMAANLGINK